MLMGPQSTRRGARRVPPAHPRRAARATSRSTASSCRRCPTWIAERAHGRRRAASICGRTSSRPARGRGCCPGGLTRVALREGCYVVNSSQGGGCKDTWVQKETGMISRVADHCFWFGRYLERAESTARVLQVTRHARARRRAAAGAVLAPGDHRLRRGGRASSHAHRRRRREGDGEVVQRFMTWDEENRRRASRARVSARPRERALDPRGGLPRGWEAINELHLWMHGDVARDGRTRSIATASTSTSAASTQLVPGPVPLHDAARRAARLHLARRAARARQADGAHARRAPPRVHAAVPTEHQVVETALWLSLLRACSGFEAFMKRHRAG